MNIHVLLLLMAVYFTLQNGDSVGQMAGRGEGDSF